MESKNALEEFLDLIREPDAAPVTGETALLTC